MTRQKIANSVAARKLDYFHLEAHGTPRTSQFVPNKMFAPIQEGCMLKEPSTGNEVSAF